MLMIRYEQCFYNEASWSVTILSYKDSSLLDVNILYILQDLSAFTTSSEYLTVNQSNTLKNDYLGTATSDTNDVLLFL